MKLFRFSLTFSILSSLACILGLTWILLSLISFKTAEQDLLSLKSEEGKVLLATFNSIIPRDFPLPHADSPVSGFISQLSRQPDFGGIIVIDSAGKPVYEFGRSNGSDERLQETLKSPAETSLYSPDRMYVTRYAPIRMDGKMFGASRLTLSLAGEHGRLKRSRQIYLAYFALDFLLLLVLGSYFLSRIIVVPIKKLLNMTERIAAGDYSHTVHVPGGAEISDLAESFNLMQVVLKGHREEVNNHVRSLEQANLQLQSAREETIRSEKMASVGLLAAGMAHEIGTPLSSIMGYTEILRDELENDPEKADYLRRISEEAGRIDHIIRGLLDYARTGPLQHEDLDIGAVVRDTVAILSDRESFRKIEISVDIDEALPPVHVDKHQLQQVLINIFLNARDAMPGGGGIEIGAVITEMIPLLGARTETASGQGKDVFGIRVDGWKTVSCIRLDICDSGEGIPPENLAKVFEPFFSTKEPGKGTGLGLAICSRIIEAFGGRIALASTPGKGTTCSIWLPCMIVKSEK